MNGALLHWIAFATGLLVTGALTPITRAVANRLGIVATPSADRWHKRKIPLLGGVAIAAGYAAALVLTSAVSAELIWPLIAGAAMLGVGLVDDFHGLRPSSKLLAQLLVACAVTAGAGASRWLGSPVVDGLMTIGWIIAITNAFNLLDNMDGLCAGVAGIAAVGFTLSVADSEPALAAQSAALAGATCGFLIYNFYPASIFMGDTGSLFIGATLAVLALRVEHQDTAGVVSVMAFPVLLMLIPLFDTAFVTLSRRLSARKASIGGRDHTSHRLVAMGFPEPRAVLLLYALAAFGGITAVVLRRASIEEASLLTGVLVIGLGLLGVRLARVNVYGGQDFALLKGRSYTPLLVDFAYKRRVFELLLDLLLAGFAYYAAYIIRFGDQFALYYSGLFVQSLPIVLACELVGLSVAGVYQGLWRYLTLSDLATYVKGLTFGTLGTLLVLVYLYRFEDYSRGVFLINVLLFGVLVVGSRLSFRALGDLARRYTTQGEPVLIYGAGDGGALLAHELRNNTRYDYRLMGFLDDDPAKKGRSIFGLTVFGGIDQLDVVLGRFRPTVILVSTSLEASRMERLRSSCFSSGTRLLGLEFRLRELLDAAVMDFDR